MAEQSQARQNSWVQDLNDSVEKFQRRDKWTKLLKISIFSVGGIVALLTIFIWSSGKLYFVFPSVSQPKSTELADNTVVVLPESKAVEPNLKDPVKDDFPVQMDKITPEIKSSDIIVPEIPKAPTINYMTKHRPKNTLNVPAQPQIVAEPKSGDFEKKTTFYATGSKWLELNYENGKQNGKQFGWYENGNPMYELNYIQGKKNGKQIWWDRSGKITTEKIYRNGEWLRNNDS